MIDAPEAKLLDRYQVVRQLGQGRHGAVYEAIDRSSGERIALKELRYVNAKTLAHFKQEFRALQEVHHPNLVRLDALFEDRGKWVIAMELVEGTDLLSYLYVDDDARCFDERVLRDAFLQLAKALETLHTAGLVHRDLKPANVRVTPEGRVVLLDFGLAAEIDPRGVSMRPLGLGTVAYMAPEQADRSNVGPAADWYAFGVCLYEALSGIRPIDAENPRTLIAAKRFSMVPPVSTHAPGIPADLERLCSALLQTTPQARPTAQAIRRVLQGGTAPLRSSLPALASIQPGQRPVFEGRERELALLEQRMESAQNGTFSIVLIEGDSGIGKSALVEQFISRPREAMVLRSRCYENELLAYKAFDGAMDGLADGLSKLAPAECVQLMPPRVALLCKLFPALEVIPALAHAPLSGLAADPSAQRLEAFTAFSQLMRRLSERAPIVFVVDDLQWADAESFRLLEAWLQDGAARCMVIATLRPRSELEGEAAAGIGALRTRPNVTELALPGLPPPSARALARKLIGPVMPDAWFDAIVKESAGHPLFLTVLARFAESHDPRASVDLTLDVAITSRIGDLPPNARRLLETVAIAGTPLSAPLCGRAAGLSEVELGHLATDLCRQKLLRRRRAGEIACFHDRIRRVTLECLPPDQARALHRELAAALAAQDNPDAARLARHYEAGGELVRALQAYAAAGDKALSTLAFNRADLLYGRALGIAALLERPASERVQLQIARGHALARSGRSAQAAREYLEAAKTAQGEDKTRLRIWAAQHLLQSAHVEEGMQAARALLSEIGVPMPTGFTGTVARLLWDRTRLSLDDLEVPAERRPIGPKQRMQLDALWGLAMPVSWLDPLASVGLTTRHLRLARAAGEPTHMGRALAEEAFTRQFRDPHHPKLDVLLSRARQLSDSTQDPALDFSVSFREATVAMFAWNLPRARERLEHAEKVGTERCADQPWLLTNVRITLGAVYNLAAEHAHLASCSAAWLLEARDRNDQFALSLIEGVGMGHLRHVMAGNLDEARARLAAALAPWPREPFSYAHWGEVVGVMHSELVRGGDTAYRWLHTQAAAFGRAFMLKVGFGRTTLLLWRARACLGAHALAGRDQGERLLTEARTYTEALERIELKAAAANALSLRAQLAALEGNAELALTQLRTAREQAANNRYVLLDRTLAYLEGLLEGGQQGAQRRQETLAFFAQQGWTQPRRALCMLCPALDSLERSR